LVLASLALTAIYICLSALHVGVANLERMLLRLLHLLQLLLLPVPEAAAAQVAPSAFSMMGVGYHRCVIVRVCRVCYCVRLCRYLLYIMAFSEADYDNDKQEP
jgi:hypothetical protein